MKGEMVCPVCERAHIPADHETCPQCKADLTCFRVLDDLKEEDVAATGGGNGATEPAEKGFTAEKKVAPSLFWALSVVLAVLMLAVGGHRLGTLEVLVKEQQATFHHTVGALASRLEAVHEKQEHLLSLIEKRLESDAKQPLETPRTEKGENRQIRANVQRGTPFFPRTLPDVIDDPADIAGKPSTPVATDHAFHVYRATDTDTLWSIAQRFYGAGYYYPVVLYHNPELSIYRISQKDRIKLLRNAGEAGHIYQAITALEGNRRYWLYKVRPGDTPMSIKMRYCPDNSCLPLSLNAEPGVRLPPGKKIKLQLAEGLQ